MGQPVTQTVNIENSPKPVYNKYVDIEWWKKNIDPSDSDLTKKLQFFLGIEVDGMFGYNTQKYWVNAVDKHNEDKINYRNLIKSFDKVLV